MQKVWVSFLIPDKLEAITSIEEMGQDQYKLFHVSFAYHTQN